MITQREYDLIKEIGEIERECRERIKPLEDELRVLSPPLSHDWPMESRPLFGSLFHKMFGFDL